jgi:adenylyltransferase/sulfurtransferase
VLPTVVATVGSIMATEVIKVVTGVGAPLIGRVTVVDALTGGFRELSYSADPTADAITALVDYDAFCGIEPDDSATAVTPLQLATMRWDEITLLDVREPWEAAIASLPGSRLMPLNSLDASALEPTKPVVVYCHHGIRSAAARAVLAQAGLTAIHLAGGIDAWARDRDPAMARY